MGIERKRTFRPDFGFALALLLAGSAWGGSLRASDRPQPRSERISRYFQRPTAEIKALRGQGFGFGEIVKILVIAEMSGRPLPELVEKNRQGYGWGAVCRQLGLNTVRVKEKVDGTCRELAIHVRPTKEGASFQKKGKL